MTSTLCKQEDPLTPPSMDYSNNHKPQINSSQRRRIKPDHLEILEEVYRTNQRPSKLFRNTIAKELGLPNKVVRVWFQNRRAKSKKSDVNIFEKESEVFRAVLEEKVSEKGKKILFLNDEDLKTKKRKGELPKIPFVSVIKMSPSVASSSPTGSAIPLPTPCWENKAPEDDVIGFAQESSDSSLIRSRSSFLSLTSQGDELYSNNCPIPGLSQSIPMMTSSSFPDLASHYAFMNSPVNSPSFMALRSFSACHIPPSPLNTSNLSMSYRSQSSPDVYGRSAPAEGLSNFFKADSEQRDEEGNTPLIFAASAGHVSYFQLILRSGADLFARNYTGDNALLAAIRRGRSEIVRVLLDCIPEAELSKFRDAEGMTALHLAASLNLIDICQMLIKRGASLTAMSSEGLTACETAIKRGHLNLANLLNPFLAKADDSAPTQVPPSPWEGTLADGPPETSSSSSKRLLSSPSRQMSSMSNVFTCNVQTNDDSIEKQKQPDRHSLTPSTPIHHVSSQSAAASCHSVMSSPTSVTAQRSPCNTLIPPNASSMTSCPLSSLTSLALLSSAMSSLDERQDQSLHSANQ
eukprot:TRINITY_DN278_c0_g2_i1.p1 TRINITY_DN278_c0_g2~~TRINITY_DN278_c0_g2_i1.p1  ORF type:complete len:577 (-),score=110.19 TRINITY_DN278_c0_g2_i1:14-1744(-)